MRLSQWIEIKGRGEIQRIHMATGIAYTTVHALAHDQRRAQWDNAELISAETGQAVTVADLCGPLPTKAPPPPLAAPPKSKRKRKQRNTRVEARAGASN
jgi:hypothetical protein